MPVGSRCGCAHQEHFCSRPVAGFSLVPSCADVTGRGSGVPEPMVQALGSHSAPYMEPINR